VYKEQFFEPRRFRQIYTSICRGIVYENSRQHFHNINSSNYVKNLATYNFYNCMFNRINLKWKICCVNKNDENVCRKFVSEFFSRVVTDICH
jgi:hypothetical protein